MAQSEAQAFKDDYTQGVIDGAVQQRIADEAEMAFGALPEQDMGEVASVYVDLDRGTKTVKNDGIPLKITGSERFGGLVETASAYANPMRNQFPGDGATHTFPLNRNQFIEAADQKFRTLKQQGSRNPYATSENVKAFTGLAYDGHLPEKNLINSAIGGIQGAFGVPGSRQADPYEGTGGGYSLHDFARDTDPIEEKRATGARLTGDERMMAIANERVKMASGMFQDLKDRGRSTNLINVLKKTPDQLRRSVRELEMLENDDRILRERGMLRNRDPYAGRTERARNTPRLNQRSQEPRTLTHADYNRMVGINY